MYVYIYTYTHIGRVPRAETAWTCFSLFADVWALSLWDFGLRAKELGSC